MEIGKIFNINIDKNIDICRINYINLKSNMENKLISPITTFNSCK